MAWRVKSGSEDSVLRSDACFGVMLIAGVPVLVLEACACCCRVILEPAMEGRLRLDAATWGTMGVGLGYAIAAATARPERLVVAIEGDSAFGFSGMECETISRCTIWSPTGCSVPC